MISFAIIGRIPGGEDDVLVIQAKDVKAAKAAFRRELHQANGLSASERRDLKKIHGADCYITGVVSGSQLTVVDWTP